MSRYLAWTIDSGKPAKNDDALQDGVGEMQLTEEALDQVAGAGPHVRAGIVDDSVELRM